MLDKRIMRIHIEIDTDTGCRLLSQTMGVQPRTVANLKKAAEASLLS